jgi:putative ABC transport system permease protein
LLAIWAVHYFRVLNHIEMPPGNPVSVNRYVVAFTAFLAVVTALIFGLVPALKASRLDLIDALKANGRSASSGPSARIFGKILVAAEITLSLALLVGAGLLIQSVNRLASVPLGFRTTHVLTSSIELPQWSYGKENSRTSFYRDLLQQTSALPGIESAAFASSLPLNNGRWRQTLLTVEGRPVPNPATAAPDIAQSAVTPDYFHVMGVPIAAGRRFEARDQAGTEPVAIVNEALARKYFPHENPMGKRIKVGEPGSAKPWLTIVGVVSDEKDWEFFHEMSWVDIPQVFRPVAQDPPQRGSLVFRTAKDNLAIGTALQKQIAALDSSVPVGQVETLDRRVSKLLAYPRFRASVLGAFAAVALILAAVGLYGVLSHLSAQRTQEFGLRMALGAQQNQVLAVVIREGLLLTGAGLIAGLALALSLTRLLSGLLYGVKPADPRTLLGFSLLLLLVSLFATYLPARRAAKIDPIVALRYE